VNQALALKVDDAVLEMMGADLDETLVFAAGERNATVRRRSGEEGARAEAGERARTVGARGSGAKNGTDRTDRTDLTDRSDETEKAPDAAARVAEATRESVARVLGTTAAALDEDTPFLEFGVDSVLAVEIIRAINLRLSIELRPTDLFNYATLAKLNRHILAAHGERLTAAARPVGSANGGAVSVTVSDDDALMLGLLEQLEAGKLSAEQVAQAWEEKRARTE
jgi:acyl carrier protein